MFATGGAYIVETNKLSISNNSFCKEILFLQKDLWLLGIRKCLKIKFWVVKKFWSEVKLS